jgi:hypothetical protein
LEYPRYPIQDEILMAVYIYTGKLGGGKTLCAVARIKEKIEAGCIVATNLDLDLVAMFGHVTDSPRVIRIPDKPKIHDLNLIGYGNTDYDESKNGLLVLDECGTWFNSRNWNDKDRKPVNDWFLHARKYGWDVILIIQDIKLLDSQARDALAEHTAFCRRLDRVQIPLIGALFKAVTGFRLRGPKLHVAKVVYGTSQDDLVSDRHVYKGTGLYDCYDTKQLFLNDYSHGCFSYLTPWHIRGRYQVPRNLEFYMRMTKIYWKRFKAPAAMFTGALFGAVLSGYMFARAEPVEADHTFAQAEVISNNPGATDPAPVLDDDEPAPTVAEIFADYRISGYMQSDSKVVATIRSPDGQDYTSSQLEELGYFVMVENNCTVTIRAVTWSDSHTLIAPNCTIRPHDKPAYDLSKLKNVPQLAAVVDF